MTTTPAAANVQVSLNIDSLYGRDTLAAVDVSVDGMMIVHMNNVDEVTSHILDTIVVAPPARTSDATADEQALTDWARANLLLPFTLCDRSGEHLVTITASTEPAIVGMRFELSTTAPTAPVPVATTA